MVLSAPNEEQFQRLLHGSIARFSEGTPCRCGGASCTSTPIGRGVGAGLNLGISVDGSHARCVLLDSQRRGPARVKQAG